MYIISACLLGSNCKYNGGNNHNKEVVAFCKNHKYVLVCPETSGGLKAPRPPAEIIGDRVVNKDGEDVTDLFLRGAQMAFNEVKIAINESEEKLEGAILKANSPSCGCGKIYDGSFTGKLIDGDGYFAKLLEKNGINVLTEKEIHDDKL